MFKHILVPTDGTPTALKAARAAIRLAAAVGARVTAIHAIDASQPLIYGEAYASDARTFVDFERAARESGARQVGAVGRLAKAARVPFASLVAKARTPYEGIVDAARRKKCDLIFIASRAMVTHRFRLEQIEQAYDLFSHQREGVLKVAITP